MVAPFWSMALTLTVSVPPQQSIAVGIGNVKVA